MDLLLAGDVGGTKTALALVSPAHGTTEIIAEATYDSRSFGGLDEIVAEFLRRHPGRARWASFSVAGPVIEGRAAPSNLAWRTMDEEALADGIGLRRVRLLNDLQSTAYALPGLAPRHILTLQAGVEHAGGARAVIAPGTGLGEAFLLPAGGRLQAYPSEGGNADFAPTDDLQVELLRFLRSEGREFVSYEHVCSGLGIPNIYRFLRASGRVEEPEWLAARLAAAADPTPVIVEAALQQGDGCEICALTLRVFASVLAAEAGNLALRVLATGGVYLGGGIPPRIVPVLRSPWFVERFRGKGGFVDLLSRIPLHVVMEPRAALLGAAQFGLDTLVEAGPVLTVARS